MTQLATNATIADVIKSLQGTVGTLQKKTGVVITPSNTDIPITLGTFDGTLASGKVLAVPVDASKVVSGTVIAGTTGTATIESLGGKKFASGITYMPNFQGYIDIHGLSFVPKMARMGYVSSPQKFLSFTNGDGTVLFQTGGNVYSETTFTVYTDGCRINQYPNNGAGNLYWEVWE